MILAKVTDPKSASLKDDINAQRRKLIVQIEAFRAQQETYCPTVGDLVASQTASKEFLGQPERERLYLPSEVEATVRSSLELDDLADLEARLREGEAFDAIRDLQTTVKMIEALFTAKQLERGQKQHTRALQKIEDAKATRDRIMGNYNAAQAALVCLRGKETEALFPVLKEKDIVRRSTCDRAQPGDSRRMDGKLWELRHAVKGNHLIISRLGTTKSISS